MEGNTTINRTTSLWPRSMQGLLTRSGAIEKVSPLTSWGAVEKFRPSTGEVRFETIPRVWGPLANSCVNSVETRSDKLELAQDQGDQGFLEAMEQHSSALSDLTRREDTAALRTQPFTTLAIIETVSPASWGAVEKKFRPSTGEVRIETIPRDCGPLANSCVNSVETRSEKLELAQDQGDRGFLEAMEQHISALLDLATEDTRLTLVTLQLFTTLCLVNAAHPRLLERLRRRFRR